MIRLLTVMIIILNMSIAVTTSADAADLPGRTSAERDAKALQSGTLGVATSVKGFEKMTVDSGQLVWDNTAGSLPKYKNLGKVTVTRAKTTIDIGGILVSINSVAADYIDLEIGGEKVNGPLQKVIGEVARKISGSAELGADIGNTTMAAAEVALVVTSGWIDLAAAGVQSLSVGDPSYFIDAVERIGNNFNIMTEVAYKYVKHDVVIPYGPEAIAAGLSGWETAKSWLYYQTEGYKYDLQNYKNQMAVDYEASLADLRRLKGVVDGMTKNSDDWMTLAYNWRMSNIVPGNMPVGSITPIAIRDQIINNTRGNLRYEGNIKTRSINGETGVEAIRSGGPIFMTLNFDNKTFGGGFNIDAAQKNGVTFYKLNGIFSGNFSRTGLNGTITNLYNEDTKQNIPLVAKGTHFDGQFFGDRAQGIGGTFSTLEKNNNKIEGSYATVQDHFRH